MAPSETSARTEQVRSSVTPTVESEASSGWIVGEVAYPADDVENLKIRICAENVADRKLTCVTQELGAFKIAVTPGEYEVFASLLEQMGDFGPDYRSYYSEFVTCGSNIKCKSHKPIRVTVTATATVKDVRPDDWYNND